jgi:hypothetical protein
MLPNKKLRGNEIINYQQLGLCFRLYSCEVLFNRGICQLYLGKMDAGLTDLYHAHKARMTEEHDVIDQAVKDRGKGYSVFSIPPCVIFRPPENRLKQFQGVEMFAVVDQLKLPTKPMQRNNSILLSEKLVRQKNHTRPFGNSSPRLPSPLNATPPPPSASVAPPPPPQKLMASTSTPIKQIPTSRTRKDSNLGMYHSDDSASILSYSSSSYRYRQQQQQQDGRRVDSGFESSLEDRYSSSSSLGTGGGRNSAKSYKNQRNSPPPMPPIPKHHDDELYGDFDQELDEVYGSLHTMSVQDRERDRIRNRLVINNGKEDLRIQSSTSTSTVGSNNSSQSGKIKIKIHYIDTRILLVSNSITFDELKSRIRDKFGAPASIRLQYKDEDNEMVLMIDDDDLFMARQVNKSVTGELEKMEIWCVSS